MYNTENVSAFKSVRKQAIIAHRNVFEHSKLTKTIQTHE